MSPDFAWGVAFGISAGLGIEMLILAAYHDHVMHQIKQAEEEWELDREALRQAYEYNDTDPPSVNVTNLSPEEWRKHVARTADR